MQRYHKKMKGDKMNRVNIVQSLIEVSITVYVAINVALRIYPSYGEQGNFEIFQQWSWLGILICPAMIVIYAILAVIFPKEYNVANDDYARHVRSQSIVFGFFAVLLTYSICIISMIYGNMSTWNAIFWTGTSFASPLIFGTWKTIRYLLGNVKKQNGIAG